MTKKTITSIAKTDTYKSLSTFSSVKEMNLALQHYQIKFDTELTNTEKTVLVTLSHYSCIYPGVSFLRKRKIGELVGKSRRTIILHSGLQSLKITLQATKQKTIRNLPGYFNGTLKNLLKELYFSTLHELGWNEKTASTPIGTPAVSNLSYTLETYISQQ